MNKKELIDKKEIIQSQIDELKLSLADINTNIAIINCPFSIGDIVINDKGVKARITRIYLENYNSGYGMLGVKFKKNGDPYKNNSELYSWNDWKKYES